MQKNSNHAGKSLGITETEIIKNVTFTVLEGKKCLVKGADISALTSLQSEFWGKENQLVKFYYFSIVFRIKTHIRFILIDNKY